MNTKLFSILLNMSIHEEHDIFRHTKLRYLGYANEIGEAFRYQISFKLLASSYILSTGYVIGDAIDKGYKSYKHLLKSEKTEVIEIKKTAMKTAFYCLVWQLVATEIFPAFIIYQVVKISKKFNYSWVKNPTLKMWFPTLIGLSIIPLFPYTIDPAIDKVFDSLNLDMDQNII